MNSKLLNKTRTPLPNRFVQKNRESLPSTSRISSNNIGMSSKPVSGEEHNRVLVKNRNLAKENAIIKCQINAYKESIQRIRYQVIDLKQQLVSSQTELKNCKLRVQELENMSQVLIYL